LTVHLLYLQIVLVTVHLLNIQTTVHLLTIQTTVHLLNIQTTVHLLNIQTDHIPMRRQRSGWSEGKRRLKAEEAPHDHAHVRLHLEDAVQGAAGDRGVAALARRAGANVEAVFFTAGGGREEWRKGEEGGEERGGEEWGRGEGRGKKGGAHGGQRADDKAQGPHHRSA